MKKGIFFIAFFFPLLNYAQTKIYIEPTVKLMKAGITSTSSIGQSKLLSQPYGGQLATRSLRLSGPNVGVNIGASFAGGKRRVSVGVNIDNAVFGYETVRSPTLLNPYSIGRASAISSVAYSQWNLTFEQRLSSTNRLNQWYVIAGIGVTFNSKKHSVSIGGSGSLTSSDTSGMATWDATHRVDGNLPFSPSFTVGLKADFYSKKGKYLLSSSLFYTHGIDNIATMNIEQTSAVGLQRVSTWNTLYSKGSGITLQVSRRLNLSFDTKKEKNIR